MIYYKEMALEHYDNDVILNSPEVQAMRTGREWPQNWNLELFDLKKYLPEFYGWIEQKFRSNMAVTRFFVTTANSTTVIHEDEGYRTSLNIPVINCENNYNRWYSMVPGSKPDEAGFKMDQTDEFASNNGGAYLFEPTDVTGLREQCVLDKPYLFCTDVPHNTITKDLTDPNFPRIVLSVRTVNMRRENFNVGLSIEEMFEEFDL